jgi:hypothetical protein
MKKKETLKSKKTANARGKNKPDPQRTRLMKELGEAITQVDKEGLLFLLRQANVLIHNARVDRINREAEELQTTSGKSRMKAAKAAGPSGVSIEEADGGKTLFLVLGRERKVMSLPELKQLVHICYSAETKSDALRQLYTVLGRERKDILIDAGIGSPSHPLLDGLFQAIRSKYRLQAR